MLCQAVPSVILTMLILCSQLHAAPFHFTEDTERGQLILTEGDSPVFTYNFGGQLAEGVDEKYRRSGYIHPLYDLDGHVLTDDFPQDHPHHRGVFWAWPETRVRGEDVQTWLPSPLRQRFVRWIDRTADDNGATLAVENEWILHDREKVAREIVRLQMQPATENARVIDVSISVEAIDQPVEIFGKRYGGLTIRLAPKMKSAQWTTDKGVVTGDQRQERFAWVDVSSPGGLAVFAPPDHRDFPPRWLLRSSYGAVICNHWPTKKPFTLQPGKPLTLNYRIYLHRGDAQAGHVQEAYKQYAGQKE